MKDYGIRISKDGKDVGSCADVDTFLTSKYPFFKGSVSASGYVNLTDVAPSQTVEIVHGLGYIPFYTIRCTGAFNDTDYLTVPCSQYYLSMGGLGMSASATADANKIYLTITQYESDFGPTMGNQTYYYTVFIYKDKMT